jgi:membrane associated rhomboid family serine protease
VQRPCQPEGRAVSETAQDRGQRPKASGAIVQSPPEVLGLIALLALIHAGLEVLGAEWQIRALDAFAFIPGRLSGGHDGMLAGSRYWSFLTYAFLHAGWLHLLFNGLWLLIFGTVVARFLGPGRFLLLAAFAAVTGAAAALAAHWGDLHYVMVGASGAVSGLMGAAVPIIYSGRRSFRPLGFGELLRSRGALVFLAIWLAITLLSGASDLAGNPFSGDFSIAWEAHVGGFAGGLVAFYLLLRGVMRS